MTPEEAYGYMWQQDMKQNNKKVLGIKSGSDRDKASTLPGTYL